MSDQVVTVQPPPPCRRPTMAPKATNANAIITLLTTETSLGRA